MSDDTMKQPFSRRTALRWMVSGAGLALLAACSTPAPQAPVPPTSPPAAPKPTTAPAAAPTTGVAPTAVAAAKPTSPPAAPTAAPTANKLVISLPTPQYEGNEIRMMQQPDSVQWRPMYEYLVGFNAENGKLEPQLATDWTVEDGGKLVTFTLRSGVQFHGNTGEFTSKDVERVWKEIVREDSTFAQSAYWRKTVASVEASSPTKVVFRLAQPDANFLHAISYAEAGMEMYSSADLDAKGGKPTMQSGPPAGTGPYQFKQRAEGQYIQYERVPYKHWRATPDFQQLELRWQKEASARLAALQSGEAQMASLPQDLLLQAQKNGFQVFTGKVPGARQFFNIVGVFPVDRKDPSKGFKYPDTPLADPNVRRALSKAINRDELNKAFFGGKGKLLLNNPFDTTRLGWNPAWETRFQEEYGFDAAAAKKLLADAGYSASKPLQTTMFIESRFSGQDDVCQTVAGYWRDIGVDVTERKIEAGQSNTLAQQYKIDNAFELVSSGSAQLIGMAYNSYLGYTGVEYPDTDELVEKIYLTVDQNEQDKLWRQLGDLMYDRHMQMPLFWTPVEIVANAKAISGYIFPGSAPGQITHLENVKAAA
jgi:ABC-type transport system substrate-binding protein